MVHRSRSKKKKKKNHTFFFILFFCPYPSIHIDRKSGLIQTDIIYYLKQFYHYFRCHSSVITDTSITLQKKVLSACLKIKLPILHFQILHVYIQQSLSRKLKVNFLVSKESQTRIQAPMNARLTLPYDLLYIEKSSSVASLQAKNGHLTRLQYIAFRVFN